MPAREIPVELVTEPAPPENRSAAQEEAVIGFVLDELSGEADLDAESVTLVNRAAPFPRPPPGAQDSFAIEVAFGMGTNGYKRMQTHRSSN